jgi:hypothetical protein
VIKKVLARVAKATDGIDAPVAVANTIGPADMGVGEVWSAVASHLGGRTSELTPIRDGIVWNLRLPRTLLAAVCGAGLAIVPLGCPGHARTLEAFAFVTPAAACLDVSVARTRLMLLCVTALNPPPVCSAWTTGAWAVTDHQDTAALNFLRCRASARPCTRSPGRTPRGSSSSLRGTRRCPRSMCRRSTNPAC